MTTLQAGDRIEAKCTKCREATMHTIVAMVGNEVAKVQCIPCGGVHKYRPVQEAAITPAKRKSSGASSPRSASAKAGVRASAKERDEWERIVAPMDQERALPYAMDKSFAEDDLIDHPVFGIGIVRRTVKPDKMEVLFQQGLKLLRCSL